MKKSIVLGILFVVTLMIIGVAKADTLTIRPNAQGYYSDWTNSGCSSGSSEWDCVNEDPANTGDNLYTSSKNVYESFAFEDTGLSGKTINSVTLYFYGQRYSSTRYQFQPLVRSASTNYLGSVKSLNSTYGYYSQVYTTNPATGSAWTIAQVDALEAGMKSYSANYGGIIAQVYAVVDYSNIADSCYDSDGGFVYWVSGNVTGYLNQSYYQYNDYCADSTNVVEYYCVGGYSYSSSLSCLTNSTTTCSNGRCI